MNLGRESAGSKAHLRGDFESELLLEFVRLALTRSIPHGDVRRACYPGVTPPGVGAGVNDERDQARETRCCRNVSGVRRDERVGRARKTRRHRCNTIATVCVRYCWYVTLDERWDDERTRGRRYESRSIRAPSTRRRCPILPTLSLLSLSLSLSSSSSPSTFLFITRRGLSFRFVLILGVFAVHTAPRILVDVDYHAANLPGALSIKNVRAINRSRGICCLTSGSNSDN